MNFQPTGHALIEFWGSLGSSRGFAFGALVPLVGVMLNIRALQKLEEKRATIQKTQAQALWEEQRNQAQAQWDREHSDRERDKRREVYSEVMVAMDELGYLGELTDSDVRRKARLQVQNCLSTVRLVSNRTEVVKAVDGVAAAMYKYVSSYSTLKEDKTLRDACLGEVANARYEFMIQARAELELAQIDIEGAAPSGRGPTPAHLTTNPAQRA